MHVVGNDLSVLLVMNKTSGWAYVCILGQRAMIMMMARECETSEEKGGRKGWWGVLFREFRK